MVKFVEKSQSYQYFNDEGEHVFLNNISYEQAAHIIFELIRCPNFHMDTTVMDSLLLGMWKLQNFSDELIKKLSSDNEI